MDKYFDNNYSEVLYDSNGNYFVGFMCNVGFFGVFCE